MNPDTDAEPGLERLEQTGAEARAPRPSLLSLLVEAGVADEVELRKLAEEARQRGLRLGELVVAHGWLDEDQLGRIVAEQWRLPFLERTTLTLDPSTAGLLSVEQSRSLGGCVIGLREEGLLVAVAEPTTERLNQFRDQLGAIAAPTQVRFAVVSGASLEGLLGQLARLRPTALPPSPQQETRPEVTRGPHQPDGGTPNESEHRSAPPEAGTIAEAVVVEALLADLEQASAGLATLHERVEQLGAAGRASEQQAADLRRQRDTAGEEAARQQQRVRELEQTLDHERARGQAFRQRLVALLEEFDR
jgi:hypothetical protein